MREHFAVQYFAVQYFALNILCVIALSMWTHVAYRLSNSHFYFQYLNAVVNAKMCEEEVNVAPDLWQFLQMLGNKPNSEHCGFTQLIKRGVLILLIHELKIKNICKHVL